MAADVRSLLADLAAETEELTVLLRGLDEPGWRTPTPAAGWDISDQVSHLAYFDDVTTLAATDPERFDVEAKKLTDLGDDFAAHVAHWYRDRSGSELLGWFEQARSTLLETLASVEAGTKLRWFGPPMSVPSSATARLMETWAHGQDVADALGVQRRPTDRLRHIAHLGVATVGWSFAVRQLPPPDRPIRISLTAPDGSRWQWGPEDAADVVTGPALDFCLLVTQRRHHADLDLQATGAAATRFLEIAQVFAGPPGAGRPRNGEHP
ncbi:TIGR03084 family metal-binding protein [Candidatus Protofrankia californiensis]|uniref:TIGR03084 family metal-binding protein n=1 Tax=Candidatus Protofrankia californiensis TaxID=1839754 RepID=UPI001040F731|nr:TIGR03084 family metal-binding protein [Candidatus Protofrankia californiensis]